METANTAQAMARKVFAMDSSGVVVERIFDIIVLHIALFVNNCNAITDFLYQKMTLLRNFLSWVA